MTPRVRYVFLAVAAIFVTTVGVTARQSLGRVARPAPEWPCLEEMHNYYMRRFESAEGFGLSRMPQPPMLDRSGVLEMGGVAYSIERLELVGLLASEAPVAYVPVRHNVKFDRANFLGRALSASETRALEALAAGRHVVSDRGTDADTIEVLGALRGDGSCLKCHKDRREGDLLGAFNYTLRRVSRR